MEAGVTFGQIAGIITHSTEYYTVLVNGWFQKFLHRNPNPGEAGQFVNLLAQGRRWVDVINIFVQSNEYFARAGNNPNNFINQVFEDLLNRLPSPAEGAHWSSTPNIRQVLPTVILYQAPNEFFQVTINNSFMALLRRLPNTLSDQQRLFPAGPYGAQGFVDALAAGANLPDIQAQIISSAEYLDLARGKAFWGGARWLS
jgi:hypothetical protein